MHNPRKIYSTMGYKLSFQISNQHFFSPYQSTHSSWINMKMKIEKLEKEKSKQIHKLEKMEKIKV
jgi:hypothetical protein